jgi:hypothetical protein
MTNKSTPTTPLTFSGLFSQTGGLLDRLHVSLMKWPYGLFLFSGVIFSLLLSILFFSPKFWLMQEPLTGTFEWDRALTFLKQCQDPFNQNIEAAMRWRFLPPLVAHTCGLVSYNALILPYLGLALFLGYWLHLSTQLLKSRVSGILLTSLLASTSGIITITNWLGINDAWFLIGLLAVTCGKTRLSLVIPGLLAPWVDERFFIGWPLAFFCRYQLRGECIDFKKEALASFFSFLPYFFIRGVASHFTDDKTSVDFLTNSFTIPVYFSYIPLGWWMGLRGAWVLLFLAVIGWYFSRSKSTLLIGLGCLLAGLISITFLAADLSRSTNLLFPMLLCGAAAIRKDPLEKGRMHLWLFFCLLFNLLTPYISITYTHVILTWPIPFEIVRFFKNTL